MLNVQYSVGFELKHSHLWFLIAHSIIICSPQLTSHKRQYMLFAEPWKMGSRLRSPYINYHSSCFNQQLYQIGSEGGREWNHYYKFIKHVSPFHLRFCIPPKFKFSNILFHHSPSGILVSIRITLLLLL